MGVRRSHERAVQLAFEDKVGHEPALAHDEAHVLAPQNRGANALRMGAHRTECLIERAFIVIMRHRKER
jgi:hypothetical protein